eukprot:scaffold247383_cov38-Cyclotella_meneghiniana.AAC.1
MDLRAMTTYFKHDKYTTHTSNFTSPPTPLTLDSISVSSNGVKNVRDCKVCKLGVPSDHSAILLTICLTSIKHKDPSELSLGAIDWHTIRQNEDKRNHFNNFIKENMPLNPSYSEFNQIIMDAGYATATTPKYRRVGWFENDKENLQPLILKKSELLHKIRNSSDPLELETLKATYKLACKETKDRTELAKKCWAIKLGNEVNELN